MGRTYLIPGVEQSGRKPRHPDDFWKTPPEPTIALVRALRPYIGPVVHEPFCGEGHMAVVLAAEGLQVIATDLIDRGYGTGGVDFFANPLRSSTLISNPPFKHAAAIIDRVCAEGLEFFALLLKATFWHADERFGLYCRHPPKMTLPLTWRIDFTGEGRPTMECAWFVWGSAVPGPQAPMLLRKPKGQWGIFS